MRIYLAGPCDTENRSLMVAAAKSLRAINVDVYCPWELKIENAWDYSQEEWAKLVFNADIKAIKECDAMIVISLGRKSTAGTNWEQGYAYGLNKLVYVLQITEETTSLMTFWGCSYFKNTNKNNLQKDLDWIISRIELKDYLTDLIPEELKCRTVLT